MHRVPNIARCAGLAVALAVAAASTQAQDSVSRNSDAGNGLPGDALNSLSIGTNQRASYVVDLVPLTTSGGTTFGIAPIVKSGRLGTARFNAVNGPSAISQTVRQGAAYPSTSYTLWTQPGGGVNTAENLPALNTSLSPTGSASVFAVGVLDFADATVGATTAFFNTITGALVAMNPSTPTRLFVRRVVAANNSPSLAQADRAQFGFGSVDAHGNIYFRADSTIASGTTNLIPGDNLFRVALASRSTSINTIDSLGGTDTAATSWLLVNSPTTHATPQNIPQSLAGRPLLLGDNLLGQYIRESSPGVLTSDTAHRPTTADHRGAVSFSPAALFAGSVGTGGVLARTTLVGRNTSISLFGLDANGVVTTARTITLPVSVVDQCDFFNWPLANGDFRHYESQVTFRGGNGPVAIAKDQSGRALAAAVVYNGAYAGPGGGSAANPFDALYVARFDPTNANSSVEWTAAAWVTSDVLDGKDLVGDFGADGAPGTSDAGENDGQVNATDAPIGRLASQFEAGLGQNGPSISPPMLDAAGNLWFVSAVSLKRHNGTAIVHDFTHALVRGVYNPASFCYTLELVLPLGRVVQGANSGKNYQVVSLGLADTDSVASHAPWSASISGVGFNGEPIAGLPTKDSRTLGGLVLSSRVVYDMNSDGLYQDPTLPAGNSSSPDEAYSVVLYLGHAQTPCPADFDDGSGTGTPDGGVTIDDLVFYLTLFEAGDVRADIDDGTATGTRDGGVTIDDLIYFLTRFELGC